MTGIERLRELTRKRSTIAVPLVDGTYQGGYVAATEDISEQLRDIIDQIEREHAEDAEAVAWVRDHGGLEEVRRHWTLGVEASTACGMEVTDDASLTSCLHVLGCLTEYDVPLAHAVVAERWPGGRPDECGNDRVMGELRRRLVPDGMEWLVEAWPRFEGGEPVRLGEEAIGFSRKPPFVVDHVVLFDGGEATVCAEADHGSGKAENFIRVFPGERVKRPAPRALDADGVDVELSDDLYSVEGGLKFHVSYINRVSNKIATDAMFALDKWADPAMYTHRAPVLAADGRPLREGETVWVTMDNPHDAPLDKGDEVTVKFVPQKTIAHVEDKVGSVWYVGPDDLTHERPDSWERLEEDAESLRQTIAAQLGDYDFDEFGKDSVQTRLMALVRRAKALAGDA